MESSRNMLSKKQWFACTAILVFVIVLFAFRILMDSGAAVRDGIPLVPPDIETTVLTSPLDANGDVVYGAALNANWAKGVRTENNSIVKYLEAFGPEDFDPERLGEVFAAVSYTHLTLPTKA